MQPLRPLVLICLAVLALALAACGGRDTTLPQLSYPPTTDVTVYFSSRQVPEGCKVFAQVLAVTPAGANGQEIAGAMRAESTSRGANAVLVGQARELVEAAGGFGFTYHGPAEEFACGQGTCWRFGDKFWTRQGPYVGLGYDEWDSPSVVFDTSMAYKAMFLRCP